MRVPIRKPGQFTHLKSDPNITEEKFNELKAKLQKLKKISRPRAVEETSRLALLGDFSENAGYQIAKGKLRFINQQILEIEETLKKAKIIKPDKNNKGVQLGQFVTIETAGKKQTFQILGSTETNPDKNIISSNSPLGKALINRRVDDAIQIQPADKVIEYKIIDIK